MRQQGCAHCPLNGAKDGVGIAKTHLGLGWVGIHIHIFRRHLHHDDRHRVTPNHQQGMIRLHHGARQFNILHWAAIHEQGDAAAAVMVERGQAHKPAHGDG